MAKPSESVRAVITQLESIRASLQTDQDNSEIAHSDWEDEEDKEAEEPDVLNNEEDIDKLDRAINFLEKAVDELDD